MTASSEGDSLAYPAARAGYFALAVLMVASLFAFLDRYLFTLLVQPIRADLGLSDSQIGLLAGLAFAFFYSVMALPLGWMVDRYRRTWLIAVGVTLWSLATIGCGLARNFEELFIARAMVGVGEATLMPAAYSLLADLFPPAVRGRVYSVFTMSVYGGGGLGLLLGAGLLGNIGHAETIVPLLGPLQQWQIAFLAAGLPGFLIALLLLRVPEPKRRPSPPHLDAGGSFVSYLGRHRTSFAVVLLSYTLLAIVAFGLTSWMPALMSRRFGLSVPEAGLWVGVPTLVGGLLGAVFSGVLGDRWTAQGRRGGKLRLTLPYWIGIYPALVGACFLPSPMAATACFFVFSFLTAVAYVSAFAIIQDMAPSALRGRTTAFWYLVTGILGNGMGPMFPPLVAQLAFGRESALPLAIAVIALPCVIIGSIVTFAGLNAYDRTRHAAGGRVAA